jgi:hypothetical protein
MEQMDFLQRYYSYYSDFLSKTIMSVGYILKYNYNNPKVLQKIYELTNTKIPFDYSVTSKEENRDFVTCLCELLSTIDNDMIGDFFEKLYPETTFIYDENLTIEDSKATIIKDGEDFSFTIKLPKIDQETNLSFASKMHELAHFSMIYGDVKDYYEYSEALSMFFEFLMYEICDDKEGYKDFISNRMALLRNSFSGIRDDLYFAMNPHYLGISKKKYELPLASQMSYPESLEYALNLIDRRDEDKEYVYKQIAELLYRTKTLDSVAKTLDIDTSKYEKILSLTKKRDC